MKACDLLANTEYVVSVESKHDAHEFPKEIIITQVGKFEMLRIHITYFNGDTVINCSVPLNFEFKLIGTSDIVKRFENYKFINLHNNLRHNFTIGSDPEMFITEESGNVIPAFNFLGSKQSPNKTFPGSNGDTNMYWDGFQAEFDTKPDSCLGWHTDSVQCGIKGLYQAAKKHNKKAVLSLKTTLDISSELLQTSLEEHVQFGCMPSFNIYGMKGLDLNGRDVPFRSAGGHIHFGFTNIDHDKAVPIVKALDAILAVACVSLFASFDDPRRRSMYGLAGEYRLPPHGLEYRVLSNAWLSHPAIMNLVFDVARKAAVLGQKGLLKHWIHDEAQTIDTINTCNVTQARQSLERNKDLFMNIIRAAYIGTNVNIEATYNVFMNGMESVLVDPTNIESNWLVGKDMVWADHARAIGKNWSSASNLITTGTKVA